VSPVHELVINLSVWKWWLPEGVENVFKESVAFSSPFGDII
jgi:hypothetical protein